MTNNEKLKIIYKSVSDAWRLAKNYKSKWSENDWNRYIDWMNKQAGEIPDAGLKNMYIKIIDAVATYLDNEFYKE